MTKLSIVLPILNEEKNIVFLVKFIKKYLNKIKYEIIFIDDNSTDNSKKIIKKLITKNKLIKYYNRTNKVKDLSLSCSMGISKSNYDHVLIMDSDLQHHPKYIMKMVSTMKKNSYDIVIASRKFKNKNKKKVKGLNLFRYISSLFLIYLYNLISINKSYDPMSGFFIFKKELFLKSKKKMYLNGYKILADLLTNAYRHVKIGHIFIDFYQRNNGKTKMNIKVIYLLIKFLVILFFRNLFSKKIFL